MAISQQEVQIAQLASLFGYGSFGAWLSGIETQYKLTHGKIAKASEPYFIKANVSTIDHRIVGYLVRDERYPLYKELEPLYRGLVEGLLLPLSPDERDLYLYFARKRIEARRRGETVSAQQWDNLASTLVLLTPNRKRKLQLQLIRKDEPEASQETSLEEDPNSRRLQAIGDALRTDTQHLLEREEWVTKMLRYPDVKPVMKMVVVQGASGVGKSFAKALLIRRLLRVSDADLQGTADDYALALLIQSLEKEARYYLIPYLFDKGEEKTSEDYLDEFLAAILADLTRAKVGDETKQQPLETRMSQVMSAIKARREKVILLLDRAQCIFSTAGEWSSAWAQFFEMFTKEPHSATMYLFTRSWSVWSTHQLPYVTQTELSELSSEASVTIWQHLGFRDVPEDVLRKISARCGHNPQMVEMLIGHCQKRSITTEWGKNGTISTSTKSANTERLEALLAQDSVFTRIDAKTRTALRHALTSGFSHQAQQLLECLACSPLGLPLSLLVEEFVGAEDALADLESASALDLNMVAANRAAVIPFVKECVLQSLLYDGRMAGIESRVTDFYSHWLNTVQDFKDDHEKAALVAEMVVRYIRMGQLLKAADLFIRFGWLCSLFGQVNRIQRIFEEVVKADRDKDLGDAYESGRILFFYHLPVITRKEIDRRARDTEFHWIYNLILEDKIRLDPHTEIQLVHMLMVRIIHERRYQEAYNLLQAAFERICQNGRMTPDVLASFLHNKAFLLGKWSRHSSLSDEVKRLTGECITVLSEAVSTLRGCLKKSLPVQERRYEFKLARALNDFAYYSRMLGQCDVAESAIRECLFWKDEKKADTLGSLAISLSEYAQILLIKGEYRKADENNNRAIQLLDQILQSDGSSASGDKGMLLVERAHIYEMQGRLEEEKQLLREALSLLNNDRETFRIEAEQRLASIQVIEESSPRYQLDSHWYKRYLPIAQFDDLALLAQAGPFSDEEKRDWDEWYPRRKETRAQKRLAEIIGQSKEREFKQSAAESRLPHIHYPAIDIDDVRVRMNDFSLLKHEIAQRESNPVIRRLYMDKIEEQLLGLSLIEATYNHDTDTLRMCNEDLYGRVSRDEMTLALREFFKMLMRAQQSYSQAREVAEQILKQLKRWGLSVEDFLSLKEMAGKKVVSPKFQLWRTTPVSSQTVQKLYEEALKTYGFSEWCVVLSPDRDGPSIDLDLCELYVPTNNRFTILSVADFLAEEIETHIFRSVAGKRSKVALLGSGTRGFLPTEEGLAVLTKQEMLATHELENPPSWITTLAAGIASGVLTPPQSFRTLLEFFNNVYLANHLQSGRYKTSHDAEDAARHDALSRVSRTFYGIPDLEASGVCNLKDRVYLQGYREVSEKIKTTPIERLLVGSIGIGDLEDMEHLHILEPAIKRQCLAHDPQLFDRIIALEK